MKSQYPKIRKFLPAAWLALGLLAAPALAAGTGDPSYSAVVAAAKPLDMTVDWQVRLTSVSKRFYTYTLGAHLVPDRQLLTLGGRAPAVCRPCALTIVFQGRPQDSGRPAYFRPGELVAVDGVVLRNRPAPVVLASSVAPRSTGRQARRRSAVPGRR